MSTNGDYDPWEIPVDPWEAITVKREIAIDIRNEASAVKMKYADKAPTGNHKKVVVPARHHVYTQEELAHMQVLAEKREAAIAFRNDVKRVFRFADADGSGQLDLKELTNIRQSLARAESTLEKNDQDGSGTLNFDEFLEMMMVTYRKTAAGAVRILQQYEAHCAGDVVRQERRSRRD